MASRHSVKQPTRKPDWEAALEAWAVDGGGKSPPLPPSEARPDLPVEVMRVAARSKGPQPLSSCSLGQLGAGGILPL